MNLEVKNTILSDKLASYIMCGHTCSVNHMRQFPNSFPMLVEIFIASRWMHTFWGVEVVVVSWLVCKWFQNTWTVTSCVIVWIKWWKRDVFPGFVFMFLSWSLTDKIWACSIYAWEANVLYSSHVLLICIQTIVFSLYMCLCGVCVCGGGEKAKGTYKCWVTCAVKSPMTE